MARTYKHKTRYIIGVDLGTTNSTVAYIDASLKEKKPTIRIFDIPQLTADGIFRPYHMLPSFLYLPGQYELPPESKQLPWDKDISYIVGEYARIQGAMAPTHLVSSAKSWLCHNRVNRAGPILPWGRETVSRRVSPVEASSYFLKHIKDSWNYTIGRQGQEYFFEEQQVIITIPASFDESARELTSEAAKAAGIERFSMLEEPQAAFYSWLSRHSDDWHNLIEKNKIILVLDIGGGTTDLNLIALKEIEERLTFERVAVGEHLMLGGDNMDLTLAREMEKRIVGHDKKLEFKRWLSLAHQCRIAKEFLLGQQQATHFDISILGTGRSVVGGAIKLQISKDDIERIIVEGFFKDVPITEEIKKDKSIGFQEIGLPFVSETLALKHVSFFLKKHAQNPSLQPLAQTIEGQQFVRPDMILFNGGVFKSQTIQNRTIETLEKWFKSDDWRLSALESESFDHAVSIGAAYYGWALRGKGVRISGGSGRSYYIAAQTSAVQQPAEALSLACIVPRGFEEGDEIALDSPEFHVMTNQPVGFPLFSSSYRIGDKAGDIVTLDKENFIELPPIKTALLYGKKTGSIKLPISLNVKLTEFGTLDVYCQSKTTPHRWKLAFQVRMDADEQTYQTDSITLESALVDDACELLEQAFNSSLKSPAETTPDNVLKKLIAHFTMGKGSIPLGAIRKLWDRLIQLEDKRTVSAKHESRWLNMAGFFLRPGFGYPLDDYRCKQLWKIFHNGVFFKRNIQNQLEWWILWRRVAGGLNIGQQETVFNKIAPWLLPSRKRRGAPSVSAAEIVEMWLLAASLERLPVEVKTELGAEVLQFIQRGKTKTSSIASNYWILSRIGARMPFYGPHDRAIPPQTVEQWLKICISMSWTRPKDAAYCVTQLARKTGDRTRDIDESLRQKIVEILAPYECASLIRQLNEIVQVQEEDEKAIFGESLPAGLYIG